MNQTQQTPSFSVVLLGHELKYEVECILKLFIPATKFQFYYEDRMPLSAPQPFAAVQVRQGRTHTWFYAAVRWKDGKLSAAVCGLPVSCQKKRKPAVNIFAVSCCFVSYSRQPA